MSSFNYIFKKPLALQREVAQGASPRRLPSSHHLQLLRMCTQRSQLLLQVYDLLVVLFLLLVLFWSHFLIFLLYFMFVFDIRQYGTGVSL